MLHLMFKNIQNQVDYFDFQREICSSKRISPYLPIPKLISL